jgi:hypothetical protein
LKAKSISQAGQDLRSAWRKNMDNLLENKKEKWIRAKLMRHGKEYAEYFRVKECGSWEKAKSEAKKWLEEKIETLPPRQSLKNLMTKRNHSGVVGVNLNKQVLKRSYGLGKYEYWKWIARWPNCPNKGGVAWSTNQLGDEDAFILAVITRQMEITNRDEIKKEFSKVKGTKEYKEILKLKKQHAP